MPLLVDEMKIWFAHVSCIEGGKERFREVEGEY
jgi:hypothetical protein